MCKRSSALHKAYTGLLVGYIIHEEINTDEMNVTEQYSENWNENIAVKLRNS